MCTWNLVFVFLFLHTAECIINYNSHSFIHIWNLSYYQERANVMVQVTARTVIISIGTRHSMRDCESRDEFYIASYFRAAAFYNSITSGAWPTDDHPSPITTGRQRGTPRTRGVSRSHHEITDSLVPSPRQELTELN
jgi:hypothetical protein